ncbi:MAG: dihydrofolate reductase family protein [Gaiellaceae bacterium]
MGKLVVTEFISLDGVIEEPRWTFDFDQGDGQAFKGDELRAADAQLLGRITYEGFAAAWPTMEGTGWFGEKFNAMPKFVVSTTLEHPEWNNSTVLRGVDEVTALKERFDGDILVSGSGALARSLFERNLVDQLNLMVFPILLGKGKRLLTEAAGPPTTLELVEARPTGSVVILIYRTS